MFPNRSMPVKKTASVHKNYFVRSVKFFFAMLVLTSAMVAVMIATGMTDFGFDALEYEMFHTFRFAALLGVLVLFSAVYPLLKFTSRHISGKLDETGRPIVLNAFDSAGYDLVGETDGVLVFRPRSFYRRLRILFDDAITIQEEEGRLRIKGHRNGVFRVMQHWDAYYTPYDAKE